MKKLAFVVLFLHMSESCKVQFTRSYIRGRDSGRSGQRKNRGQRRIENPGRQTGCEYDCNVHGDCQVEWVGTSRAGPSKGYCTTQGRCVSTPPECSTCKEHCDLVAGEPLQLHRKLLTDHPRAICNDKSIASYYKPASPHSPGQNVLLYLEGGGGCFDKKTCTHRCTVASPELCKQDEALVKNFTGSVWSADAEENPGMHNNYKVYVPYCTSDIYSGRKDADDMSAEFAFHGKYVVEAVVDDLLSNALQVDISQFVLMGMSAGAFGVGNNCDAVAKLVRDKHPETDVRCIMDGLDFYPIEHSKEGCDPVKIGAVTAKFWQAELEQSCQEENGFGSPVCLMFTTYYPYIETPFMVVVPYEDTNMEVHPCTPPLDEQPKFWETWRDKMYRLAFQLVETSDDNGIFISNCRHHVSHNKPVVWGSLEVPVLDWNLGLSKSVTYKQAVANWLENRRPFQALDNPNITNSGCHYQ